MSMWELGSDFHLYENLTHQPVLPYLEQSISFGSGRCAIAALVELGVKRYGWKHIAIPAYYCDTVVQMVERYEIAVSRYQSSPDSNADVWLVNNLFGLTQKHDWAEGRSAVLIEDHTHDLLSDWAIDSEADYCFASLRKSLPVPDGGLLWSPRGLELPKVAPVTKNHEQAAHQKLAAMVMKWQYLKGRHVTKSDFRMLFIDAEKRIGNGAISGMLSDTRSLLKQLPVKIMREKRMKNFLSFSELFQENESIQLLRPKNGLVPFMIILLLDEIGLRNNLRAHLINRNIYPAILWGEAKMLAIACDYRYRASDMKRVAQAIHDYGF